MNPLPLGVLASSKKQSSVAIPDIGYGGTLGRPLNFDAGTVEGLVGLTGTTVPVSSTDQAASGTRSLKCSVASGSNGRSHGDYAASNGSSVQYFTNGAASGNSVWFAWDMYVSNFTAYNSYKVATYWSHDGTAGTSAIYLRAAQNTSNWELAYNAGGAAIALGAIALNTWERWVVNINFSSVNTVGEINVWRNGTQVVTALKPSSGTYDSGQASAMTWRIGWNRNSADTTLNTVYFDNIACGTTRAKVDGTSSVVPSGGTTLFSADWESGIYGDYLEAGADWNWPSPSSAPIVTTEQAYSGTKSCKFTIPSGGTRCEGVHKSSGFNGALLPNNDLWFSYRIKTINVPNTSLWQVMAQWKNEGNGSPPIALNVESGLWYVSGGFRLGTWYPWSVALGSHSNNVWDRFVLHILFSSDNTIGTINVWRNGSQVVTDYKPVGGTLYPSENSYLKYGYYRDSSIAVDASIYFDDIKIGTTADSVGGTA